MVMRRICFVGDSILLGAGDLDYLGWPGRLCVAEGERGHDVSCYNLGVRGDTSDGVRARWQAECTARLPDWANGALVFAFGLNDMAEESGTGIRVPMDRALDNARAVLGPAREWLPTLMIGPIPTVDDMQPYVFPNGMEHRFDNGRTAELSARYGEICGELGIPYLQLHDTLSGDGDWDIHQRNCDGVHARGAGYAIISRILGDWGPWRALFDG